MLGLLRRMFVQPWSATFLPGEELDIPVVTPLNALRYTPIYRAITLIAGDIARLPCEITDSRSDSLWANPSPYMSAFEFRRSMTLQTLLWGNAFAVINRTRGGEFLELMPLDPDGVSMDLAGPTPIYKTRMYGDIMPENMLHIRAPGLSGLWGESPIRLCTTSITTLAAQEQTALNNFRNGGSPRLALIHPGMANDGMRQKIAEEFKKRHGGSRNAGEPIVLGDNMKLERISSTLEDAGLEAARKYSIEDVSRIYGVPSLYLGMAASGNAYGSLEWAGRMYVDACLQAWLACWRSEWLAKTAPFARMNFDLDALLRPGMAEHMAALRTGVEAGFLTRNEARAQLDLEPLSGLDEPTLALNVGTGGGSTNIGTDTSAQEGTANDF